MASDVSGLGGSDDADLPRQVATLVADHVSHDLVAVATTASRTLLQLGRDASSDVVEEAPRRLEQSHLAFQLLLGHGRKLERGRGEGDAPEVGRSHPNVVLDDLEPAGHIEFGIEPGQARDRPVPIAIRLEQLDRRIGSLRPATPAGPVDGEGCDLLLLRAALDDRTNHHAGKRSKRTCHSLTGMRATMEPMRNDGSIGLE